MDGALLQVVPAPYENLVCAPVDQHMTFASHVNEVVRHCTGVLIGLCLEWRL